MQDNKDSVPEEVKAPDLETESEEPSDAICSVINLVVALVITSLIVLFGGFL